MGRILGMYSLEYKQEVAIDEDNHDGYEGEDIGTITARELPDDSRRV